MMNRTLCFYAVAVVLAAGCGGAPSFVEVSLSGEEGAVDGITAEDGWEVSFSKYLVSVGAVVVGDSPPTENFIADLSKAQGDPPTIAVTAITVDVGNPSFGFSLPTATTDATSIEVSDVDVLSMEANGLVTSIAGSATNGARTVAFDIGIKGSVRATACTNGETERDGLVVELNASTGATITFHVEHFLFDRLSNEEAELGFAGLAAAAGDDDVLTSADLEATAIDPLLFDAAQTGAQNMLEFVSLAVRSQAHLNGEGLCTIADL